VRNPSRVPQGRTRRAQRGRQRPRACDSGFSRPWSSRPGPRSSLPFVGFQSLRLVIALAVLGCGGAGAGVGGPEMAVSTAGLVSGIKAASGGRVFGPDAELIRTEDGYRGVLRGLSLELHAAPGRVFGHVGIQPVDLHVVFDGVMLEARGMFAGKLGRLALGPQSLRSSLGPCSYELDRPEGREHLAGERACMTGREQLTPRVLPADLDLPAAFAQLEPERQAMLLLMLLGGSPAREGPAPPAAADDENPRAPRVRYGSTIRTVVVPRRR
jgi:hypothetical protein